MVTLGFTRTTLKSEIHSCYVCTKTCISEFNPTIKRRALVLNSQTRAVLNDSFFLIRSKTLRQQHKSVTFSMLMGQCKGHQEHNTFVHILRFCSSSHHCAWQKRGPRLAAPKRVSHEIFINIYNCCRFFAPPGYGHFCTFFHFVRVNRHRVRPNRPIKSRASRTLVISRKNSFLFIPRSADRRALAAQRARGEYLLSARFLRFLGRRHRPEAINFGSGEWWIWGVELLYAERHRLFS